jgi:hypothetical protein
VLSGSDQLDRDGIGQVLRDKLLLPDALKPRGGGVQGRFSVDGNRVVDVPP